MAALLALFADDAWRAVQRYSRVMIAIELWAWPWMFGITGRGAKYFDGNSYTCLHFGPLALRVRWRFEED
jgi:hypothetical protein